MKRGWFRPVSGPDPTVDNDKEENVGKRRKKREQRKAAAAAESARRLLNIVSPQPEPEVQEMILNKRDPQIETHTVSCVKDIKHEYPQLYLEVFFSWEGHEKAFGEMWARAGCSKAASLETADLVVFPGGSDVDPAIYSNRPAHHLVSKNRQRDDAEMKIYAEALSIGIPMLGVCRGAQLLWVMQGGELFQHVDGHKGNHLMKDVRTGEIFDHISSTHHQLIKPSDAISTEILAVAPAVSAFRYTGPLECDRGRNDDIEAFFCPETCCLGVQGHPEFRGYSKYTKWVMKLIEDKIVGNPRVRSMSTNGHGNYRFMRKQELVIPETYVKGDEIPKDKKKTK